MTDITLRIRPAEAITALERSTTFDAKPEAPSAESICAVIVTYHPDTNICDHVGRIVSQVSQTVIVGLRKRAWNNSKRLPLVSLCI